MNRLHSRAEINPEHPRINKRSELQQQYRDELAKTLIKTRKSRDYWDMGIARHTLKEAQNTEEYLLAREGISRFAIGENLLSTRNKEEFLKNLSCIKTRNENIAKELIIKGAWRAVAENLERFFLPTIRKLQSFWSNVDNDIL